ncbi:unnamed protein product, partial [Prorocentrum cordatum]
MVLIPRSALSMADPEELQRRRAADAGKVIIMMSKDNIAALGVICSLSILGAIYLWKICTRHSCSCRMCRNQYRTHHLLGSGGYGSVWLVERLVDGRQFVSKKIPVREITEVDEYSLEAKELIKLRHRHIVSYEDDFVHVEYGALEPRTFQVIIMEYCPEGDLKEKIEVDFNSFTEQWVRTIFAQLLQAVQYLHSKSRPPGPQVAERLPGGRRARAPRRLRPLPAHARPGAGAGHDVARGHRLLHGARVPGLVQVREARGHVVAGLRAARAVLRGLHVGAGRHPGRDGHAGFACRAQAGEGELGARRWRRAGRAGATAAGRRPRGAPDGHGLHPEEAVQAWLLHVPPAVRGFAATRRGRRRPHAQPDECPAGGQRGDAQARDHARGPRQRVRRRRGVGHGGRGRLLGHRRGRAGGARGPGGAVEDGRRARAPAHPTPQSEQVVL